MQACPTYSAHFTNSELIDKLHRQYAEYTQHGLLLVNINQQCLYQIENDQLRKQYKISSAANGTGNQNNSGKTPLGAHFIREKFGDNVPFGSQFKARQLTGVIPEILSDPSESSQEDYITSRIFWLSGLEAGYNQGKDIDSYHRYIYIHGTNEEGRLGTPASHGCIRMANQDVIDLYSDIDLKALVYIYEQ